MDRNEPEGIPIINTAFALTGRTACYLSSIPKELLIGSGGQEVWSSTRSSFDQDSQVFGAKAQIIGAQ